MLDPLLDHIAPHYCCGCNKIGTLLCDNCKYDIITDEYSCCIICSTLTDRRGICRKCSPAYARAWCVGARSDALRRLVDGYKFYNTRSAYGSLAELLFERIGQLPEDVVIVPVPTVPSHIRTRGYDHTLLVARRLAKLQRRRLATSVKRVTCTTQRGASKPERIAQAKVAFEVCDTLDPMLTYLLVDDVTTTGATLEYATRALLQAGAESVWVATVARQPFEP